MEIIIKNMVCARCEMVLAELLTRHGYTVRHVELGKAEIAEELTDDQRMRLSEDLETLGFSLLDDRRTSLVNQIKATIINYIHHGRPDTNENISTIITRELPYDYAYLSRLFSAEEGRTIEQFTLANKIEKVKELIDYGELTLSEIADQMQYSSSAHLSNQFKKITGLSPTQYRAEQRRRRSLDQL